MACTFYREPPNFELRFICNFKGCLDDRPKSVMGAIEHQAFHFSEVYKTQAHFNFKCEYCNVYHVNKSHHRLCLDDPIGIGHLPHLRTIYPVPMSDPEFHSCVDFGRFANNHMVAVTANGTRLVPSDRMQDRQPCSVPSVDKSSRGDIDEELAIFGRRISAVSYRDLDGGNDNAGSDLYSRSSGGTYRNQTGGRESRGRGGPRGRGDRGGGGRGRGRGGGYRNGGDGDNSRGDNSFRGRGRGWEGSGGRDEDGSSHRFSGGNQQSNNARGRSYSRSRSNSPVPQASKQASRGGERRSYSRSRSSSPVASATNKTNSYNESKGKRSYSRSGSESPVRKAPTVCSSNRVQAKRRSRSYSRSGSSSRSPSRNDINNNRGATENSETGGPEQQRSFTTSNPCGDADDYVNKGYGSSRRTDKGFRSRNQPAQEGGGGRVQERISRSATRSSEASHRNRSYSKSGSECSP
ncbi:hypothetical protein Q1695_014899 [Nippostrongylus brasiliensis]|nr:hypothetical protein Q1695_014899 [Nippostrongylus brasiliensis]